MAGGLGGVCRLYLSCDLACVCGASRLVHGDCSGTSCRTRTVPMGEGGDPVTVKCTLLNSQFTQPPNVKAAGATAITIQCSHPRGSLNPTISLCTFSFSDNRPGPAQWCCGDGDRSEPGWPQPLLPVCPLCPVCSLILGRGGAVCSGGWGTVTMRVLRLVREPNLRSLWPGLRMGRSGCGDTDDVASSAVLG